MVRFVRHRRQVSAAAEGAPRATWANVVGRFPWLAFSSARNEYVDSPVSVLTDSRSLPAHFATVRARLERMRMQRDRRCVYWGRATVPVFPVTRDITPDSLPLNVTVEDSRIEQ